VAATTRKIWSPSTTCSPRCGDDGVPVEGARA
jgi:hypothetical protein